METCMFCSRQVNTRPSGELVRHTLHTGSRSALCPMSGTMPERAAQTQQNYQGWHISAHTGCVPDFEGDGIDAAASLAAYTEAVIEGLREVYPGAELDIGSHPGRGPCDSLSWGCQAHVYGPSQAGRGPNTEREKAMEADVSNLSQDLWDKGDFWRDDK